MIAGQIRKCKRILPVILFFLTIVILATWRIYYLGLTIRNKENYLKNIFSDKTHHQEEYVDKHGVKVIVGYYVGNPVNQITNATHDMINTNNFDPQPNAGKNGRPVVIEQKDLLKMQQLFQINRFNLLASDKIPLNRSLPDFRRKKCAGQFTDYETYPKTSIIIVFHNEAWSTLLRTVWSIIDRSPANIVKEIILVDDASEREFLKKPLEDYIKVLPITTRIIRTSQRIGLIKARLRGALASKGEVLTFLDAHCECTTGWLEALLSVIKKDRKTVVCPVIDILKDDTFAYVKSFELHWGAFNWNLQFRWYTLGQKEIKLRKNDATQPFNSPTMAGGLFAIDKSYFFEIGSYDEKMNVWGGENLEMSFRVWQCGGQIKIAPCSRVGHVFRKSSPYSFPGGIHTTLYSNLARVALVWMDEWANFYFRFNEEASLLKDKQNVTSRIELRRSLKCKSFEWYLDNIWPQHFFPMNNRFFGRIKNLKENKCLIKPDRKGLSNQPMGIAKIERCLNDSIQIEMFIMSKEGFIMTDDSLCLDAPERVGIGPLKVRIMACSGLSRQKWKYSKTTKEMIHDSNDKCLDVSDSKKFTDGLIITDCNGSKTQMWKMEKVKWK